ncbi:hypothetical protein LTS02_004847 [Friedmanniomyces endolithicus]|nr:hypothetical protein LTS02_004847 [Friedmanniomyces endolithicus]
MYSLGEPTPETPYDYTLYHRFYLRRNRELQPNPHSRQLNIQILQHPGHSNKRNLIPPKPPLPLPILPTLTPRIRTRSQPTTPLTPHAPSLSPLPKLPHTRLRRQETPTALANPRFSVIATIHQPVLQQERRPVGEQGIALHLPDPDPAALAPGSDTAPFRQVRLAKWARDLQRGLENERRKYQYKYFPQQPSTTGADWDLRAETSAEEGKNSNNEKAVAQTGTDKPTASPPSRGRLGGDIAVIDPRDPLGVLAFTQRFRRQGWVALRVAGGCGLVGALAWWVVRNWAEVQREWFAIGETPRTPAVAPPAAERGSMGWLLGEVDWRGFFGWEK